MPGKFTSATEESNDDLEHTIPINTDNLQVADSVIADTDKTVILPESYFKEKELEMSKQGKLPRTVVIPDRHFKT